MSGRLGFNTPLGHFEYRVLPFGLVNAPAVFQALVNDVLRDMLNIFVFVYLDDILIFSNSLQETRPARAPGSTTPVRKSSFVKAEKCVFHACSVSFLGSVVSAEGIGMDPAKVRTVMDWPVPDSRTALQRFLGLLIFIVALSVISVRWPPLLRPSRRPSLITLLIIPCMIVYVTNKQEP